MIGTTAPRQTPHTNRSLGSFDVSTIRQSPLSSAVLSRKSSRSIGEKGRGANGADGVGYRVPAGDEKDGGRAAPATPPTTWPAAAGLPRHTRQRIRHIRDTTHCTTAIRGRLRRAFDRRISTDAMLVRRARTSVSSRSSGRVGTHVEVVGLGPDVAVVTRDGRFGDTPRGHQLPVDVILPAHGGRGRGTAGRATRPASATPLATRAANRPQNSTSSPRSPTPRLAPLHRASDSAHGREPSAAKYGHKFSLYRI